MELSMEKTKITDVREGFDFLGYRVAQEKLPSTGRHVGMLFIPKSKSQLLRNKIKAKVRKTPTSVTLADLIDDLNPVVVGWRNYYRYATRAWKEFAKHDWWLYWRVKSWLGKKAKRLEGHCAVSTPSREGSAAAGECAAGNSPGSPTPSGCCSRIGAYAYRTDGTPPRTSTSAREPISSGRRPTPSHRCEGHPWPRPRMESRMRGNSHVRFGAGDEETCLGDGARRFIPTLPENLSALTLGALRGIPAEGGAPATAAPARGKAFPSIYCLMRGSATWRLLLASCKRTVCVNWESQRARVLEIVDGLARSGDRAVLKS